MKYEWRHGYHSRVKAQVAGEEMERTKEARRAAELYRLEQARRQIRSLAIVYEPHEDPRST